jgi:hypothetical protein
MTGKAYEKSKKMLWETADQAHAYVKPHLDKAWVAVEPTATEVQKRWQVGMERARAELRKDPYRKYINQASQLSDAARTRALKARDRAVQLWNSKQVLISLRLMTLSSDPTCTG